MSEHIKTGAEITAEIAAFGPLDLRKKQWVSLSWLKKKVKKEIKRRENTTNLKLANSALDFVLSLLEEP